LTAATSLQRAISLPQCWYAWKLVLHLSSQLAASSEQNQYKQTNLFLKLSCCLKSAAQSCHAPAFFVLAHYLQLPKRGKKCVHIYIYTYIQKGTIPHLDCGLRSGDVAGLVGAGLKCLPHSCCCRWCCYCYCCCCYSSLQLSERDMLILGTPLTSVAGRAGAHHDNSIM